MPEPAQIDATPAAPDWNSVQTEVLCPLCEYNLRGLTEPRCPECGHQFEWNDVLDRDRWEHPWLFEHARKRKIVSLLRTFVVSQFPRRFWRSVKPTQRPNVPRLVFFWLILVLCGTPWTPLYSMARMYWDLYWYESGDNLPWITQDRLIRGGYLVRTYTPLQARTQVTPIKSIPWSLYPTLTEMLEDLRYPRNLRYPRTFFTIQFQLAAAMMAWPWLTAVTLLIFRQTMRQAKIKPSHVLRCAIYAGDCTMFFVLPLTWAIIWSTGRLMYGDVVFVDYSTWPALLGFLGLMTYRLSIAYRSYLTFPQPVATCALSQIIVGLGLLSLSLWRFVF